MNLSANLPYYEVVAADIERSIRTGELGPGDMLESENSLSKRYSTSRITVRKGLAILEEAGYIKPRQGKGYFVCEPSHEMFGFKFEETPADCTESFHYIHAQRASERVAAELQIPAGHMALAICRIIRKDSRPVAVDYKYIPHEKGKPLIEREIDYAQFPEIAAAKAGPFAIHTVMEIRAELPDEEVCELLECAPTTPMLVVHRRLIDMEGNVVGYGARYQLPEYGPLFATSGYEADYAGNGNTRAD